MTDAGFVIAAWVIAAVVIGGYFARLVLGIRKAERTLPPDRDS
jgi:hypothetical protein